MDVRFIDTLEGVPDADRQARLPRTREPTVRDANRDAIVPHDGTVRHSCQGMAPFTG